MAFAVPASKRSIGQNEFRFTMPDDPERELAIPLLKYLKPAFIVNNAAKGEVALAQALFNEYLPEGVFERFEDGEQLEAFMAAWQEASGITVGESKASPASS